MRPSLSDLATMALEENKAIVSDLNQQGKIGPIERRIPNSSRDLPSTLTSGI